MAEFSDLRGTDKITQLYDANARKLESLAQASVLTRQKLAAQEQQDQNSWVSQAGFDPDSIGGKLLNIGAFGTYGAGRALGFIASLPASAAAQVRLDGLTEDDFVALDAYRNGVATPEQTKRLTTKRTLGGDPNQQAVTLPEDGPAREAQLAREAIQNSLRMPNEKLYPHAAPLDRFNESDNLRQLARDINTGFDFKDIVHQGARSKQSEQIKDGFNEDWKKVTEGSASDKISGLAGLISKVGTVAVDNPQASMEYLAENLPQLAMGMAGPGGIAALTASNVGYGIDNYQKGIEKYQKENNGAYPDEATRNRMAMYAASTVLAEQAGDVVSLGGAKALKGAVQAAKKTAADLTPELARSAFKAALRVPGAVALGGGTESLTEGYQSYAEGEAGLDPAKPENIYESMVVGGIVGGAMRGAPTAAAQVVEGVSALDSAVNSKMDSKKKEEEANAAALKAATETGDITDLVDPTKPTYAPDVAVSALFNRSQAPDATPEVKQESLSKATEVVIGLQQQIEQARDSYEESSPEAMAQTKELLATTQAEIQATDPADVDALTALREREKLFQDQIDGNDPKVTAQLKSQLERLESRLSNAQASLANFTRESADKDVDVRAEVEAIKTASTPEIAQASAQKIISLAMMDSGRLDEATAATLAADQSIQLDPKQRTYLTAFSEARVAENELSNLEKVANEVLVGSKKNVGIVQYRQRLGAAFGSGNQSGAESQLKQLEAFAVSQANKLQRLENEGTHSPRFVEQVRAESIALDKAVNEMRAAFDIRFGSNAGISQNVQDVSQPTQAPEAKQGTSSVNPKVEGVQAKASTGNDAGRTTKGNETQATDTGVAAAEQLLKKLDERMGYMNNPPDDYTPEKGRKVAAWAQRQLDRIEGEMAKAPEGSELRESLADARAAAKRLIAKAEKVIEGDESLKDLEATGVFQEAPASSVEPTSVEAQEAVSETREQATNTQADERQESADEGTESVAKEPALSVLKLSREEEKAKPFQQQNLFAVYLKQAKNIALGKTKDFMSSVGSLAEALPGQEFTDIQESAFTFLKNKVKEWGPLLNDNIELMNKDFRYKSPFQFMLNEDGTMDENIHTAMSIAVLDYVSQFGTRSLFNDWEDINTILHRPKEQQVTPAEEALLRNVGTQAVTVTGSIGALATRVLGIKDDADTPKNLLTNIQAGMGVHIVDLMLNQGILIETRVTGAELNEVMELNEGDQGSYKNNVSFSFYRLSTDENGEFTNKVKELFDAASNAKGAFTDLFGTEIGLIAPLIEAKGFNQRNVKGTDRGIPQPLKDAQNKLQKTPLKIKETHWGLLNALPESVVLSLVGSQEITLGIQKSLRKGIESKNSGIKKEWDNAKRFVSDYLAGDLTKDFFVEPMMWVNQRFGIKTQLFDPQASKLHRYITKMDSWNTTVSMVDPDQLRNFSLRVMEGLGDKTDETPDDLTIQRFDALVSKPAFQDAIAAIRKHIQGQELTEDDAQAIQEGVAAGKENMHSFDALVALARFEEAQANNQDTFDVEMSVEDDGKTNGPMLSTVLFGAATVMPGLVDTMAKGGFYTLASGLTQYSQWRSQPGNEDLYQATMRAFNGVLSQQINEAAARGDARYMRGVQAIYAFTGTLVNETSDTVEKAGRDIVKTPLQAIFFGSASKRSAESMSEKLIEGILKRIQKLSDNPDDRVPLIKDMNTLGMKISLDTTIETLMENEFSLGEIKQLQRAFMEYVGQYVKKTVDQRFATFMSAKQKMNAAANLTFNLYNEVFQAMKAKKIQELVASGDIPLSTGKHPVALFDLSKNQEKEIHEQLKDLFPVAHSWMSQIDGDLTTGIRAAKEDASVSNDSKYMTEEKTKTKRHRVRSQEKNLVEPGVTMLSALTHSFDSGISHMAGLKVDSFNNHDARTTGLNELNDLAVNLNKTTWDGLLAYSPLGATADALSRVIVGLSNMIDNGTLPPEAIVGIKEVVKGAAAKAKLSPEAYIDKVLYDVRSEQARADKLKLEFMAELGAVDQYPLQGGSYIVTKKDRDAVIEKAKTVPTDLTAEENAAMNKVFNALSGKTEVRPEPPKQEVTVQPTSPFGGLGTPKSAPNNELASFLESTPNLTVGKVLPKLYSLVQATEQSGYRDFSLKLIKMLKSSVSADMPVKYVTKLTPETGTVDRIPGATAWFSSAGAASEIAILGTDFKESAVRPSTLVHELVHASVFQTMQAERNKQAKNPKYTSEVLRLEDDLNQLLEKAREMVYGQGLTKYDRAVVSVDEMIAYGMMNPGFQQDVLAKLSLKTKTLHSPKSAIVDGFRKFIDTLTQLLFAGAKRKATTKDVDGLSLLVANTTAIMSYSSENLILGTATTASPAGTPTSLAMMGDPMAEVANLDTVGLYEALAGGVSKHSSEFTAHVHGLLQGIVNKLYGPFGSFKDKVARNQAHDGLDIMAKALQTGRTPFTADVIGSPFTASQQELFAMEQIEATVRAAIDSGEASTTSLAYNQLAKLYREARQRIKAKDFLPQGADWKTATPAERDNAQAQYDFVFKIETGANGRSDYLSRFAALGLGHEKFSKMLAFNTSLLPDVREQNLTMGERLQRVFEKILNLLGSGLMGVFAGQRADTKLHILVDRLVDIEAKNRLKIAASNTGWVATMEGSVRDMSQAARNKVADIAGSPKVRNAASGYVRGAGALVRVVAGDRVEQLFKDMSAVRDKNIKQRHSFIRDMMTEVQGVPGKMLKLLMDAKRANEQIRQDVISNTEKTVMSVFENEGKNLSTEAREGITQSLLRTGAHVLLKNNRFTLSDLATFVADKTARNKAIQDIEAQLIGTQSIATFAAYYVEKANVLGYYKAAGYVRGAKMLMNAHNIATLYGTPQAAKVSKAMATQAEPLIEALVALYALDYTGTADLAHAREVMRAEANRPDGNNGIEFLLKLQAKMEEESLQKLFKGNSTLMVHGYTPEILNSRTEIKIANEQEGRNLELQGWKKVGPVQIDMTDPNKKVAQFMYVLKGAGLQPYLSATMSLTDMAAKGHKLHSGFLNTKTVSGLANAQALSAVNHGHDAFDQSLMKAGSKAVRRDLSKAEDTFMAPVFNENGDIVNYRYLMNERTKDTVLERDSRFEKVLGAFAGSIYDKETSREQNRKAVEVLKEEYDESYKKTPDSFVWIGHDSLDPKMKEIWDMLPEKTKDDIEAVWGYRGMTVRLDSLNVLFGYRKYSLADMFRNPETRGKVEEFVAGMVEWVVNNYARSHLGLNEADAAQYTKRIAKYVSQGEQVWQEVVKEVKDIIVVKSMVVLAGNIFSNFSYLVLNGVPLKDIFTHHKVAMKGVTDYLADTQELARLKTLRDTGYQQNNPQEVAREIARLEDAIARNPVKEIIDAGLMPTIVDDVSLMDDPYSYKSHLTQWVEKKTSKIPEGFKTAAKQVYMAKETDIYQSLSRITQMSDFVARYTLYQHLTNRKNNPLSKDQAVTAASEAFVNYDVPLPKGLQYTDDMGITMFSKYFLRVQRVLLKMARENPARVMMGILAGQYLDLGSTVLGSSWMTHIGNNPLNVGALQYPTTLDELMTIQAPLAVFK